MIVPHIEEYTKKDFEKVVASAFHCTFTFKITKKYCLERILKNTSELVYLKWYQSKAEKINALRYWLEKYDKLSK
jgi:hypothetical protein